MGWKILYPDLQFRTRGKTSSEVSYIKTVTFCKIRDCELSVDKPEAFTFLPWSVPVTPEWNCI